MNHFLSEEDPLDQVSNFRPREQAKLTQNAKQFNFASFMLCSTIIDLYQIHK